MCPICSLLKTYQGSQKLSVLRKHGNKYLTSDLIFLKYKIGNSTTIPQIALESVVEMGRMGRCTLGVVGMFPGWAQSVWAALVSRLSQPGGAE